MRISYKPGWNSGRRKTTDVGEFVAHVITQRATDFYAGEEPAAAIRELKEAFGRLVEKLADRGDLTLEDVVDIVRGESFDPSPGQGE